MRDAKRDFAEFLLSPDRAKVSVMDAAAEGRFALVLDLLKHGERSGREDLRDIFTIGMDKDGDTVAGLVVGAIADGNADREARLALLRAMWNSPIFADDRDHVFFGHRNRMGCTLAAIAARSGDVGVLEFLHRRKPDCLVDVASGVDDRPLAHAVLHGHKAAVSFILSKFGAEELGLDDRDGGGHTHIETAAGFGYVDIVKTLARAGARFDPAELARHASDSGHRDMAPAIRKLKPKPDLAVKEL